MNGRGSFVLSNSVTNMFAGLGSKPKLPYALCLLAILLCFQTSTAQSDDETDPVKLFEKGQDAHAKSDYKRAIELYDAAIKLKPEFPEAEFQRAMALLFTNRKSEAIEGFNRAVALRPDWAMAYSKFGTFLGSYGNDPGAAEPILRRAIALDPKDEFALTVLAEIRARVGDTNEALKLARAATELPTAKSSTWRKRAFIETLAGDKMAAVASLDRALTAAPKDLGARGDRVRLRLEVNDREGAIADLRVLEEAGSGRDLPDALDYAQLYERAGKRDDALRVLDALTEKDRKTPEVIALRAEIAGGDGSSAEERAALEDLLKNDPKNAGLLARLGGAYRRTDPAKSQDYYYRALQLDPKNPKYATGYAAALIQGRKFAEAEPILKQVIAATPDDYTAHANLALALYELKRFAEALPEYEWLAAAKPEIAATYFFLATAHDNLGEYKPALDAYESFLSHADPANNKLEIDKVNLRLPVLRGQIQRGEGAKPKRP
jgi:tetratricopeptide (TPR) repeat protein